MLAHCNDHESTNMVLTVQFALKQDTDNDWHGTATLCGYVVAETPWNGFKTKQSCIKWLTARVKEESAK